MGWPLGSLWNLLLKSRLGHPLHKNKTHTHKKPPNSPDHNGSRTIQTPKQNFSPKTLTGCRSIDLVLSVSFFPLFLFPFPKKKRSRRLLKCRGARNRRSVVSGRVHAPLRSSELMWGQLVRSQRSCWQSSAVPGHPDTAAPPAGRDARVEERGCEKIK